MPLARFERDPDAGVLAGVCAGIARTLGVDPTLVRLVFALLALAGGAGILLYLALWAYGERRSLWLAGGLGILAVAGVLGALGLSDRAVFGIALVAGGLVLVWRRGGFRSGDATASIAGTTLAAAGAIVVLSQGGVHAAALTPGAIGGSLLPVGGPWLWRLAHERDAERAARIRSEERADLAARVHGSGPQTLALIQRHAADPRKTAAYARRQARELRSWLYGDRARPARGPRSSCRCLGARREAARRPRRRPSPLPLGRAGRARRCRGRGRRGGQRRAGGAADQGARSGCRPPRRPPAGRRRRRDHQRGRARPAGRPVPRAVRLGRGRGRNRRDPRRSARIRDEDDLRRGARGRDRARRRGRRRLLAPPRRLRARRLPLRRARRRRRRARRADGTRARGAAAHRPRIPVQGDRRAAYPVAEDGREPRLERAPEAPALDAPRADALGNRPPARVSAGLGRSAAP